MSSAPPPDATIEAQRTRQAETYKAMVCMLLAMIQSSFAGVSVCDAVFRPMLVCKSIAVIFGAQSCLSLVLVCQLLAPLAVEGARAKNTAPTSRWIVTVCARALLFFSSLVFFMMFALADSSCEIIRAPVKAVFLAHAAISLTLLYELVTLHLAQVGHST